jgi:hypothetical protein
MQNAIMSLQALGGGDDADGGWGALWTLVNAGTRVITVLGATTYSLGTNPNILPLAAGEAGGNGLGAGLRGGSLPIFVTLTDSQWHDGPASLSGADAESGLDEYPSAACNPCTNAPSRRETITALQNIGARLIGLVAVDSSTTGDPKTRAIKAAQETGALVDPGDFNPNRPAGCGANQCCTGINGVGEASQAGQCPLAFSVDGSTGADVTSAIQLGVLALANNVRYDVHAEASDVDPGTVDNFIDKLVPNVSGMGAAAMCVVVPMSQLVDNFIGPKAMPGQDMILDTFLGLSGAQQVCFDVVAKQNNTIMHTDQPQIFRAQLQVIGQTKTNNMTNSFNLGTPRDVFFLVPPTIVNGPVN